MPQNRVWCFGLVVLNRVYSFTHMSETGYGYTIYTQVCMFKGYSSILKALYNTLVVHVYCENPTCDSTLITSKLTDTFLSKRTIVKTYANFDNNLYVALRLGYGTFSVFELKCFCQLEMFLLILQNNGYRPLFGRNQLGRLLNNGKVFSIIKEVTPKNLLVFACSK